MNRQHRTPTTSPSFSGRRPSALLMAAVASLALATAPAFAQGSAAGPGPGGSGANATVIPSTNANVNATTSSMKSDAKGMADGKSSKDAKLMIELAQTNIAEVETGKLAMEKAHSEQTKAFAQRMIDDHSIALKELQTLASSKGVTLPTEPGQMHQTAATALRSLSGKNFDNRYRSHAGVGDHQRTAKLLKKIQKQSKDPEFKALATKMLPTVNSHLNHARKLEAEKV